MPKPLVVLMSGAPGAGKTTLGAALATRMRIPHIQRDEIMLGIERSYGYKINRGVEGIKRYFTIVENILDNNVSLVLDGTLYRNLSEQDIRTHVMKKAIVINVHVYANDEFKRFQRREAEREGYSDSWVLAHMDHLKKIYTDTLDPLNINADCLKVNANNGYSPDLTDIIEFIEKCYKEKNETTD